MTATTKISYMVNENKVCKISSILHDESISMISHNLSNAYTEHQKKCSQVLTFLSITSLLTLTFCLV